MKNPLDLIGAQQAIRDHGLTALRQKEAELREDLFDPSSVLTSADCVLRKWATNRANERVIAEGLRAYRELKGAQ